LHVPYVSQTGSLVFSRPEVLILVQSSNVGQVDFHEDYSN